MGVNLGALMLSIPQVVEATGVSSSRVQTLCDEGVVPGAVLRGTQRPGWRIPADALEQVIELAAERFKERKRQSKLVTYVAVMKDGSHKVVELDPEEKPNHLELAHAGAVAAKALALIEFSNGHVVGHGLGEAVAPTSPSSPPTSPAPSSTSATAGKAADAKAASSAADPVGAGA